MKKGIFLVSCVLLLLASCCPLDLDALAPVFNTGIDPQTWALVLAGDFLEGQFSQPSSIPYDYEIMVTHVTTAQYAEFLDQALADGSIRRSGDWIGGNYPGDPFNHGRHEEPVEPGDYPYLLLDEPALRLVYEDGSFHPKASWADHPMAMVSWFGAKAYCEYNGWRLPTDKEWEKAARGTDGRPFPWGDTISRNRANLSASRDPFENMSVFGSRTTPVGFYNGGNYDGYQTLDSPSPYGLYDMAGNAWQWVGDVFPQQHYRSMRGGSKDVYEYNLRVWARNNAHPAFMSPGVGFRCAR
jgi:formylglycine-generating enzyme required for sulfatase activity